MAVPRTLVPGCTVEGAGDDLASAVRIEKYRLGEKAVYLPEGFKWNYIPRSLIREMSSFETNVRAGHCVTVRITRPTLELKTDSGTFRLDFDREERLEKMREMLSPDRA